MSNKKDIFKNLYMTYSPSLYVYARRFIESPDRPTLMIGSR